MPSPFERVDARLRRLPDPLLLAIGLALIICIELFRLTDVREVPVVDFLLIPVAGVGWLAHSRGYGYAAAVSAAAISVVFAEIGATRSHLGAALVAGVARLALYIVVLSFLTAMRRLQLEREREARTDPLSGVANARAFRAAGEAEIDRSRRYRHELSLAYLDIDDFKVINDQLGHGEGDRVLGEVSRALRAVVRSIDTVARLGGDEFAILMPETRPAEARALIDRLRQDLAALRTSAGGSVLCSIGLVTFDHAPPLLQDLIDAGDDLMYRAKREGKDRVEQAERAGSSETAARHRTP